MRAASAPSAGHRSPSVDPGRRNGERLHLQRRRLAGDANQLRQARERPEPWSTRERSVRRPATARDGLSIPSGAVDASTTPAVSYNHNEMADGRNNSNLDSIGYPNGRVEDYTRRWSGAGDQHQRLRDHGDGNNRRGEWPDHRRRRGHSGIERQRPQRRSHDHVRQRRYIHVHRRQRDRQRHEQHGHDRSSYQQSGLRHRPDGRNSGSLRRHRRHGPASFTCSSASARSSRRRTPMGSN